MLMFCHYCEIAPSGHPSTQVPQSMQVSLSTTAFSERVIAWTEHVSTHVPQAVHFSLSMFIAMGFGIFLTYFNIFPSNLGYFFKIMI